MKELFYDLILLAQKEKASDIHFMIKDDVCICSLRTLKGFKKIDLEQGMQLFQYIKYRANLDLGNLMTPQSGTFDLLFNEKIHLYFRFSLIATLQSQTGVLRILNNHAQFQIKDLTKDKKQQELFLQWCHMRTGLICFSGPTNSGKTTTLNALLSEISRNEQLKVITLEDPIEILNPAFLQLQVNEKLNFTYEEGIRQLLRHDPDVIMIGEIRAAVTAGMTFRCALSGHLVFTTIHAKSAQEAIKRLEEFGLDKRELTDTLTVVVNQRLYPNKKRKERICIYEILHGKALCDVLAGRKPTNHETIQMRIQKAVDANEISLDDARYDLLDQ